MVLRLSKLSLFGGHLCTVSARLQVGDCLRQGCLGETVLLDRKFTTLMFTSMDLIWFASGIIHYSSQPEP
jgi:hypothetical protein